MDWHHAFTGQPDPNRKKADESMMPLSGKLTAVLMRLLFTTKIGWCLMGIGMALFMLNEFGTWLNKKTHYQDYDERIVWGVIFSAIGGFFIIIIGRKILRVISIPRQGPMLINITDNRRSKLIIDVKIPHGDWKLLKKAGLMDLVLFSYSHKKNPTRDDMVDFTVSELANRKTISFNNTKEMLAVKTKLIEILHDLKGHFEQLKDGPHEETIEL
jgi:hypothetical protein